MTVKGIRRASRPGWQSRASAMASALLLGACSLLGTPSPSVPLATPGASATQTATLLPTATPFAGLRLPEPTAIDSRTIRYSVGVELEAGGSGQLVVTVENLTSTMIGELVLRWPTEVRETVFLAPFVPSQQRIREGGPALRQDWTKWVEGPGERGEPAGTTSLGWGPLLAGATLTIPVLATRVAPGPLIFDLQILAGEAVLTSDGEPAWLQVSVP